MGAWGGSEQLEKGKVGVMQYRFPDGELVEGCLPLFRLVELLEENGVGFEWEIHGSPDDDNDPRAQYESFRLTEAVTDRRDTRSWWSVSGCDRWKYLEAARTLSPQEFLCRLDVLERHRADLGNVLKDSEWEDYESGIMRAGRWPTLVRITVARYGYEVESDFGPASAKDAALNRTVSALYGHAAPDFTRRDLEQASIGPVGRAIIREWFGKDCDDPLIEHARIHHDAGVIPERPPDWVTADDE
ncbi:MAG: hypothetical protein ABIK09_07000 [Pseudomonadota bacterium]